MDETSYYDKEREVWKRESNGEKKVISAEAALGLDQFAAAVKEAIAKTFEHKIFDRPLLTARGKADCLAKWWDFLPEEVSDDRRLMIAIMLENQPSYVGQRELRSARSDRRSELPRARDGGRRQGRENDDE